MDKNKLKRTRRLRRSHGARKRIIGTAQKPRLSVYRSLKHTYAQLIDDISGHTLAAASTLSSESSNGANVDAAKQLGIQIAESAKSAGIEEISFDRNGFKYHGRVKALAEAARETGLKF